MFTPKNKTKDDIGVLRTAFCGGLGGVAFWVSIFPADVVKSRVQVDSHSALAKNGFINALATILKNEGKLFKLNNYSSFFLIYLKFKVSLNYILD